MPLSPGSFKTVKTKPVNQNFPADFSTGSWYLGSGCKTLFSLSQHDPTAPPTVWRCPRGALGTRDSAVCPLHRYDLVLCRWQAITQTTTNRQGHPVMRVDGDIWAGQREPLGGRRHGGAVLSAHTVSTRLTAHRKVIFITCQLYLNKVSFKKNPRKKAQIVLESHRSIWNKIEGM